MGTKRYTEEFKIEAVKQITERGHAVADVSARLGVSGHSLYQWATKYTCLTMPSLNHRVLSLLWDRLGRVREGGIARHSTAWCRRTAYLSQSNAQVTL